MRHHTPHRKYHYAQIQLYYLLGLFSTFFVVICRFPFHIFLMFSCNLRVVISHNFSRLLTSGIQPCLRCPIQSKLESQPCSMAPTLKCSSLYSVEELATIKLTANGHKAFCNVAGGVVDQRVSISYQPVSSPLNAEVKVIRYVTPIDSRITFSCFFLNGK